MITKNCAEGLRKCLSSLRQLFLRDSDEIVIVDTGSTDDTIATAKEFGARVIERPDLGRNDAGKLAREWLPEVDEKYTDHPQLTDGFLLDFSEARQVATDAAKNDVVFWIDADDILQEETPGTFRDFVDRCFLSGKCDNIFLDYLYAFDPHDNRCTTILKRERVVDRRHYKWFGKCHETMLPYEGSGAIGATYVPKERVAIAHTEHRKQHEFSDVRNYVIIRREIEAAKERGEVVDPRSVFYLANAARGLERYGEAIELYKRLLKTSGSRDDCYSAAYYIGTSYILPNIRRPTAALDWFFRCIKIKPEDPRGYFGVARCYYLMDRHDDSLHWFRVGAGLPEPKQTVHSYDPEQIFTKPLEVAALAAKNLGSEEMAQGFLDDLKRRRPNHPEVGQLEELIKNWMAGRTLARSVEALAINSVKDPNNGRAIREAAVKILRGVNIVPEELENRGLGKVEVKADAPIVIWCGQTAEAWGPAAAKSGIGGSEKMVLEMARRFVDLGKKTIVYAKVPHDQRGLDKETGVVWRHFSEFDYERARKTVVFWRSPGALEMPIKAQRRVLWCHDVQRPEEYTPARIALADRVVVLSDYHATTLGNVRGVLEGEGKLTISRNGLDPTLYEGGVERDPNKFIFTSSPDRGVLTAIETVQKIRDEGRIDATLDVYYGFTPLYLRHAAEYEYGHIPDLGHDCNRYEYMECVLSKMDELDWVQFKGRVGFEDMAKAQQAAGVWIYPTRFPEISCMAAMEAQAAGCIVAATDYAALAETIDWDSPCCAKLDLKSPTSWRSIVTAMCGVKDADRTSLATSAKQRFALDPLARDWVENILK